MKLLDGIIDSMDMSLSKLREIVKDWKAWHAVVQVAKSQIGRADSLEMTVMLGKPEGSWRRGNRG